MRLASACSVIALSVLVLASCKKKDEEPPPQQPYGQQPYPQQQQPYPQQPAPTQTAPRARSRPYARPYGGAAGARGDALSRRDPWRSPAPPTRSA